MITKRIDCIITDGSDVMPMFRSITFKIPLLKLFSMHILLIKMMTKME